MFKKFILVLFVPLIIASCANEDKTLPSPCVGAEGSPCGAKRPANSHLTQLDSPSLKTHS